MAPSQSYDPDDFILTISDNDDDDDRSSSEKDVVVVPTHSKKRKATQDANHHQKVKKRKSVPNPAGAVAVVTEDVDDASEDQGEKDDALDPDFEFEMDGFDRGCRRRLRWLGCRCPYR